MHENDESVDFSAVPGLQHYEKKIFDLKQLIEISKGLNSTLEYNVLIDSILLTCMGHMQLIKAGIFLLKALDEPYFVLHRNYKGFDLVHNSEYIIDSKSEFINYLEVNSKCFTMDEIRRDFPNCEELKVLEIIEPMLIVPLKGKGRMNGIIVLGERITNLPFTESEKDYLLNIASLAGNAIQNAYLFELATTDMMTKLKIHHFFQTSLIEEKDRAISCSTPLSLIMLDIDHFKIFNDTYGHQCGDKVLKNVAQLLKDNCRQIDIAARYGGEEMSVILPNTDLDAAMVVAERIRVSIEKSLVPHEDKNLSVTVSIGVTQFDPETDHETRDIIEKADKALYKAKNNGRNQVQSG